MCIFLLTNIISKRTHLYSRIRSIVVLCSMLLTRDHSLAHSPPHAQRAVHCNEALTHLHLPVHPFLQPQLISSHIDFIASGRVLHKGVQMPFASSFHPQSPGLGSTGLGNRHCPQQCPPWNTALCACCTSAPLLGGMFSIARPFCVNKCIRAKFRSV